MFELAYQFGVCFLLLVWPLLYILKRFYKPNEQSVILVVLGDIGRSPRMKYHSLSLAKLGYQVSFIGYSESKLMDEILTNQNIKIYPLRSYPKHLQIGPNSVQYGLKAIYLSVSLFATMLSVRAVPKFVLVQNPPSIPTLAIAYFYCKLFKTKFVIDWHNYGFTIMALKSSSQNILVKICKRFELFFGQRSDRNLCVTNAMKNDLAKSNIVATTLYDKAHERFRSLSLNEKHEFYQKLISVYGLLSLKEENKNTIFTHVQNENQIHLRTNRPALLVSSSSWTEDEDFSLLLDAFDGYQNELNKKEPGSLPNIICILTGKGPLKEFYEMKFIQRRFENISVHFLWLDPDDYPSLLGSADLGVCLHNSSSSLDLPMKVVDMFGTRLPVCALNFSCISELVKENENGLVFSTSTELTNHMVKLLSKLSDDGSDLQRFRSNLCQFSNWNQEWTSKVKPIIENL